MQVVKIVFEMMLMKTLLKVQTPRGNRHCVWKNTKTFIYTQTCARAQTHTHMCTHTRARTHARTHTHTHTDENVWKICSTEPLPCDKLDKNNHLHWLRMKEHKNDVSEPRIVRVINYSSSRRKKHTHTQKKNVTSNQTFVYISNVSRESRLSVIHGIYTDIM